MLFLDTSALIKRYVDEDGSEVVIRLMDEDRDWAASSTALTEAEITLCRLGFGAEDLELLRQRLRLDWERFHVVPIDHAGLDRATVIGCEQEVRTLDALHLAAAVRLPAPFVMLTFDRRQADAARSMSLRVEGA